MIKAEELIEEINNTVVKALGCDAKRKDEWFTDSELSFGVIYIFKSINIEVWRDRGLYSVSIAKTGSTMFSTVSEVSKRLVNKPLKAASYSTPTEIYEVLVFIKNNYLELSELLQIINADE